MADGLTAKITVEIFPDRVAGIVDSPTGPVGIRVFRKAERLLQVARDRVGVRYSGHHGGQRIRDSGSVVSIGGASWSVQFNHPKAKLHHDGTQAKNYPIGAPGKRLSNPRDPARTRGGPFFARGEVIHPGTNANPFLDEAADALGLRRSGALLRGNRLTNIFRLRQL